MEIFFEDQFPSVLSICVKILHDGQKMSVLSKKLCFVERSDAEK